ncbi:MAG TPA: hypothetical protein VHT34_05750 [Clostridia bacterium]|nr:hypothetical protein [Clostridia bacterium]
MFSAVFSIVLLTPLSIFIASTHSTLAHELRHVKEFSSLNIPSYIVLFRKMEDEKRNLFEENWKGCISLRIRKLNTTIYFPSVFSRNLRLTGFFNTRYRSKEYVPLEKVKKIASAPTNTPMPVILPFLGAVMSIVVLFFSASICNLPLIILSAEFLLYTVILTLLNLSHFLLGKPNQNIKNDMYYYENPGEWYEN